MHARQIVVLGDGRSARWLLGHLAEKAKQADIQVLIVDAAARRPDLPPGLAYLQQDIDHEYNFSGLLATAYICVSLLPPGMHLPVMEACIRTNTHFMSASYETEAARSLDSQAQEKGILIANECGFDPGLDHVTALAMLHRVQEWGGEVISFESDSGGLPAPDSMNNWGYRFFWNPMNVVLAGSAGGRFLENGKQVLLPHAGVFKHLRHLWDEQAGALVAYPNRDSIPYIQQYGLHSVETFVRGTIRYASFCERWQPLTEAGVINNTLTLEADITYENWASLFAWHKDAYNTLQELLAHTGLAKNALTTAKTSAEVLLDVVYQCWNSGGPYYDRGVMRHKIEYKKDANIYQYVGVLDYTGNNVYTSMSFLVGLPIAILIDLQLKEPSRGVLTPASSLLWPTIYNNLHNHNVHMSYNVVNLGKA